MKALQATVLVSFLLGSLAAHADTPVIDVKVSGELTPGVYGEVHVGNAPPPPVVYAKPVIIEQQPQRVEGRPIYLNVPPGHARDWARHCHEYHACNRPVYFVKSAEYEPSYRDHRGRGHKDEGRRGDGYRDGDRRDERRDEDYRDEDRRGDRGDDDHRGHGRGRD